MQNIDLETEEKRKLYYTFHITKEQQLLLKHFLKTHKIPYRKRSRIRRYFSTNTIVVLAFSIVLLFFLLLLYKL